METPERTGDWTARTGRRHWCRPGQRDRIGKAQPRAIGIAGSSAAGAAAARPSAARAAARGCAARTAGPPLLDPAGVRRSGWTRRHRRRLAPTHGGVDVARAADDGQTSEEHRRDVARETEGKRHALNLSSFRAAAQSQEKRPTARFSVTGACQSGPPAISPSVSAGGPAGLEGLFVALTRRRCP